MSDTVEAPPHFCITIEGTTHRVCERSNVDRQGLGYLLDRLLSGQPVSKDAFAYWGLRVLVDEDRDQGDDQEPRSTALGVESWKW